MKYGVQCGSGWRNPADQNLDLAKANEYVRLFDGTECGPHLIVEYPTNGE